MPAPNLFNKTKTSDQEIITIVGCGIAGASIAYHLAKQAKEEKKSVKIRVIEQAERKDIPNPLGSSHGKARLTRVATAEGKEFIPYAKRSNEIRANLQTKTTETLHIPSGVLILGPKTDQGWPQKSAQYAQENKVPCALKNKAELKQYQQLRIKDSEIAYVEPSGGILKPEPCLKTLIALAEKEGVEFIFGERYEKMQQLSVSTPDSLMIQTNKKNYQTNKLIFSMGPWLQKELSKQFAGDIATQFSVHTCSMYSFKVEENARKNYQPDNCPVLIWQTSATEAFVFFPDVDGSGIVQFAIFPISDLHPNTTTPEVVKGQPPLMDPKYVYEHYIQPHFQGISPVCASVTNYPFTMNKDEKFIYDSLPSNPNVKIVDVGSAHGYKHALAFGEQVAQHLLTNRSELNVEKTFKFFSQNPHLHLRSKM